MFKYEFFSILMTLIILLLMKIVVVISKYNLHDKNICPLMT